MTARSGLWLTLTAAVLFGVSGAVAAGSFEAVDPVRVAQFRSVVTALILGALAYRRRAAGVGGRLAELALLGVILAAVTVTYYWAIDRLGVGPGVTVQFLGPVLVLAWMRVAQRRPVPGIAWAAALAAVTGTALMNRAWDVEALDLPGLAAGLGAAVTFAAYLVVGERLGRSLPGLTVTAYGFAFSAVILLVAAPVGVPQVGPAVWLALVWVAIPGTAVPFLLEIAALRRVDPGRVGVVATAEPVVAAAAAWVGLGQLLSPAQVVGAVLVVVGIATIHAVTRDLAPDVPQPAV